MNWLDFIGASLSLICTYYFTQAKRKAWPLSITAILLNMLLYWQKGIYGHFLLDGIYFFTMLYGWYHWRRQPDTSSSFTIRSLTLKEMGLCLFLLLVGTFLLANALKQWTPSTIPYWDASATLLSLFAQILLCLKFIECWIVWLIADALVASLQWHKAIPFHSLVHTLYLILAVMGFFRWRKLAAPAPL